MKKLLLILAALTSTSVLATDFHVYGHIYDKWVKLGAEQSPLGDATSNESDALNGRFNSFKNGYIFWKSGNNQAFAVYGAISKKWDKLGRERGFGHPISDELNASHGGKYNKFENGGYIYWKTGQPEAFAVYGDIAKTWIKLGADKGCLGYPVSDEQAHTGSGARVSRFEHGSIYWINGKPSVKADQGIHCPQ